MFEAPAELKRHYSKLSPKKTEEVIETLVGLIVSYFESQSEDLYTPGGDQDILAVNAEGANGRRANE